MVIVSYLIDMVIFVLVAQAILTWIPTTPDSPIYPVQSFLTKLVNPLYAPIRRVVPPIRAGSGMAIDVAPMILIFGLIIVARLFAV